MTDIYIDVTSIATAVGALSAAGALVYAARQLKKTQRIARGKFFLRLEELFAPYEQIHLNLRPGGAWADGVTGPDSQTEWGKTEAYMGLFERINDLISDGTLPLKAVNDHYAHRVINLLANRTIVEKKLWSTERLYWEPFLQLCKRMGLNPDDGRSL